LFDLLVFQQAQLVTPVVKKLACDIGRNRTADFHLRGREAQRSQPQDLHLPAADMKDRCGLLFVVNAKAGEEAWKPGKLEPGFLRTQNEIPVQCVVKALVDRLKRLPDCLRQNMVSCGM